MMDEYESFVNSMLTKSNTTQKNYVSKYNKLREMFNSELKDVSQEKAIEVLNENYPNKNSLQSFLNIVVLIRKIYNMPINLLDKYRKENHESLKQHIIKKNETLTATLPEYDKLLNYLNELYERKEWRAYIINYLLIHTQVRNQDLDCEIVTKLADAKDPKKNFLVYQPRIKTITFIRNVFKTAKIVKPDGEETGYGPITIKIKNNELTNAVKQLVENKELLLIPNTNTLAYTIKKYTYEGLGEGNIFKIVVNHFRENVDMLQQIALNRGTALQTILNNYDIEKKEN